MNLNNIPEELINLRQWVCTKGDSKVPMKATECSAASSTDPATWCYFDTAKMSVNTPGSGDI